MLDTPDGTRAGALSDTFALHRATLDRAAVIERQRADTARDQREAVARRNTAYLSNMGKMPS